MDKSWIQKSRTSPEYLTGAREFLDFAFARTEFGDKIPCPCIKCCNRYLKSRDDVHGDLLWNGIMKSYIHWISHGEDLDREEYITDESDVKSEHWALLVQYWSGSKAKAASTTNTANRGKQEIKHSGGTKSFANHLFEETQRRTDGSIPTLADLFLKTHTRKNGTRVDAKSAEIIDQIVDLTNREGGSLTNISDSVYHQVMGPERHGRVRGYGLGPTPTTVFGAKYTQSRGSYAAVCNQLDEMRQLMEDMKKKHAEDLEICKAQLRGEIQNEMRQMMQSMMSGQHQYTSDGEEDS